MQHRQPTATNAKVNVCENLLASRKTWVLPERLRLTLGKPKFVPFIKFCLSPFSQACFGESPVKAFAVRSAASNVTRSVKTCSMPTACKVRLPRYSGRQAGFLLKFSDILDVYVTCFYLSPFTDLSLNLSLIYQLLTFFLFLSRNDYWTEKKK